MSCQTAVPRAGLHLIPVLVMLSCSLAHAQEEGSGAACSTGPSLWGKPGCHHEFCCGINWHCLPKPPCLCYKCVCPRPLCNPCDLENYGYYPVCWRPWMQQVNWSHCPVPPPTALAPYFNPPVMFAAPTEPEEVLPSPKRDR